MRLFWLIGSLTLALAIAVVSLQAPGPSPASTPATAFAAARAMADIRQIAQSPHPVGSAEHRRIQAYLLGRMRALGLRTSTQTGPISEQAARYLRSMGGAPDAANYTAVNLIGVLPGRDPDLPAVALMAHYDTVPMSAGAADDSTGVAAVLETARAIRARGPADRTLVVLLTDAEELGLDGARAFWGGHPLRDRIGAVVNLEARGGGGRAMMFETGRGNAPTIALFGREAVKATGGVTSNSLAVFVYELMPNGSDFTVPKDRGVQGINLAFIGRPAQYHTPASTVAALDQGSVQHIGAQALAVADALVRAPALPEATANIVYADLFGQVIVSHPPVAGWAILAATLVLLAVAAWRARSRGGLDLADVGRGVLDGLWFLSAGLVVTLFVRLLGGPLSARADSAEAYYALLARLPWLEAGVALSVLAVAVALLGGRTRPDRRVVAGAIAALTLAGQVMGGLDVVILGAGLLAMGLSWATGLAARTTWGGWTGLIALVLLIGALAQAAAPETAFLFLWPALLAAGVAALATLFDPGLIRWPSLAAVALAAVPGVGWLLTLAHPVFLGIGMDIPGVLALLGLLMLMFVRPLSIERSLARPVLMAALAILLIGGAVSIGGRVVEPVGSAGIN